MQVGGFWKPEYIYRPSNLFRRVARRGWSAMPEMVAVPLWGGSLRVRASDTIGRQIMQFGVFDLAVTEALWRLTDPGDLAVDVGANVGYTAAVLARRCGELGRVMAFEAHPDVFGDLSDNLGRLVNGDRIVAHQVAISSEGGRRSLRVPAQFDDNRGIASLEGSAGNSIDVEAVRLDDMLGDAAVGVLKIDVEGHELAVLEGAQRSLSRRAVRDIVFEDHAPASSPVVAHLIGHGYSVWRLHKRFRGVDLAPADRAVGNGWESPSLLATLEPERAKARFAPRGWQCFGA